MISLTKLQSFPKARITKKKTKYTWFIKYIKVMLKLNVTNLDIG